MRQVLFQFVLLVCLARVQGISQEESLRTGGIQVKASEEDECLAFLQKHMPHADREVVTVEYLRAQSRLALRARRELPWAQTVPWQLFLNDVLPYANLDEPREDWRTMFFSKLQPLVSNCTTITEAAQTVNRDMWSLWGIYFLSDQTPEIMSPSQVISAGYASCTGLSIFLVDAYRSLGIPARVAGTPSWVTPPSDSSSSHDVTTRSNPNHNFNNHNWVEVWDNNVWSFTGAEEFNPAGFNRTWFFPEPIKHQIPKSRWNAVYAATFAPKDHSTYFPLVWNPDYKGVPAVDVTTNYLQAEEK